MQLGEEVNYHYVKSVLKVAIEQWNTAVELIRKKDPREMLLEIADTGVPLDELESHLRSFKVKLQTTLQPISLKCTDANFLILGLYWWRLCFT